jgi:DNA-binding NarL/FixJ family response regulator
MPPAPTLRLLIVEDDEALRLLLGLQLEDFDDVDVVGSASDAREALALCEQEGPNAAMVDLRLPDTPGEVLIADLRERYPDMRLVAYSSSPLISISHRLADWGVPIIDKGEVEEAVRSLRGARA